MEMEWKEIATPIKREDAQESDLAPGFEDWS